MIKKPSENNSADAPDLKVGTEGTDLQKLEAEKQELIALLQRTRADFENFRKKTEEQKRFAEKLSAEKTVRSLLPLLDTLMLAIKANDSLSPLKKTLEKSLSELKLEVIAPENDAPFDPNLHEALSMEGGEGEKEVIAEVLQPGYIYNGGVVRAALVRVKNI